MYCAKFGYHVYPNTARSEESFLRRIKRFVCIVALSDIASLELPPKRWQLTQSVVVAAPSSYTRATQSEIFILSFSIYRTKTSCFYRVRRQRKFILPTRGEVSTAMFSNFLFSSFRDTYEDVRVNTNVVIYGVHGKHAFEQLRFDEYCWVLFREYLTGGFVVPRRFGREILNTFVSHSWIKKLEKNLSTRESFTFRNTRISRTNRIERRTYFGLKTSKIMPFITTIVLNAVMNTYKVIRIRDGSKRIPVGKRKNTSFKRS